VKPKLELSKKFINYLIDKPENGMGYQVVNVRLRGGEVLLKRIVVNSQYLILNESEELVIEDIEDIEITENTTGNTRYS